MRLFQLKDFTTTKVDPGVYGGRVVERRARVHLRSAGLSPLAAEIMDRVGLLCTERR